MRGSIPLAFLAGVSVATAAPVVIPEVPSIGWASGKRSHDMAALHAALWVMGCPTSYEDLMVAPGAAFRTAWWNDVYTYGARAGPPMPPWRPRRPHRGHHGPLQQAGSPAVPVPDFSPPHVDVPLGVVGLADDVGSAGGGSG
jgi:hypothetical protein